MVGGAGLAAEGGLVTGEALAAEEGLDDGEVAGVAEGDGLRLPGCKDTYCTLLT